MTNKALHDLSIDAINRALADNDYYFVDNNNKKVRLFTKGKKICRYFRRSRRYGYLLGQEDLKNIYVKKKRVHEAQRWQKDWEDILQNLKKWNLWPELHDDIALGLSLGYKKVRQLSDTYWEEPFDKRFERIRKIAGRDVNTFVYWTMDKMPKKRKMRFHRHRYNRNITEKYLQRIEQAMLNKEEYACSGDNGYDVSFRYNGKDRAWYSEEYRGCGNGHYYLTYSPTHAFHYEDD